MVVPDKQPHVGQGDVQPADSERSLQRIALEAAAEKFGDVVGTNLGRMTSVLLALVVFGVFRLW
jgi:hypothetical protein